MTDDVVDAVADDGADFSFLTFFLLGASAASTNENVSKNASLYKCTSNYNTNEPLYSELLKRH